MAGLPTSQFDLSVFTQEGDDRVTMNGPTVFACNIQVDGYPAVVDGIFYGVYFEVAGKRYHYVVNAFADHVEVKVCEHGTYKVLSVCKPRNQGELLEVIETIGADFEDFLDFQALAS